MVLFLMVSFPTSRWTATRRAEPPLRWTRGTKAPTQPIASTSPPCRADGQPYCCGWKVNYGSHHRGITNTGQKLFLYLWWIQVKMIPKEVLQSLAFKGTNYLTIQTFLLLDFFFFIDFFFLMWVTAFGLGPFSVQRQTSFGALVGS